MTAVVMAAMVTVNVNLQISAEIVWCNNRW